MTPWLIGAGVSGGVLLSLLAVGVAWRRPAATEAPSKPARRAARVPRQRSLLKEVPDLPAWLRSAGDLAAPSEPEARRAYEMQLTQAGLRDERTVAWFQIARTGGVLLWPCVAWLAAPWWTPWVGEGTAQLGGAAVAAAGLGYLVPGVGLDMLRKRRQRRVSRAVPSMIDMIVAGVEAGLGIDMSLRHVAGELARSAPELAVDVEQANAEVAAGLPRDEALMRMVERTGVEALASLVKVLGQVEKYGSSVGSSLRSHARLTRRRRLLDAEQRAARASPLLTVVMIALILPALFIVLLGPAALNVIAAVAS